MHVNGNIIQIYLELLCHMKRNREKERHETVIWESITDPPHSSPLPHP